ncbi:MAG TPA: amino acid permease [Candidatus Aminicenantes bacterium]|nr:amino acid permease [Candidatus Aminicenantes bacterium]HRY65178.1 amino acid permease [Candidatus Aminicenantes bacterium]HRZ72354.1 amino acid permease [Candidatus Aminicenantes bacterium]
MAIESRPADGFLRKLGLADTIFLVIGAVVGSGIYMTPGLIAAGLPSPGLLILVWLAGGLVTLCGALSFAELGAMYPEAGGQYIYLREAYGPAAAFLFGWAFFGFIMCGGLAALAVGFAEFLGSLLPVLSTGRVILRLDLFGLPFSLSSGQAVAALAILILTLVNTFGIRSGAIVQNVLTILRLATAAAFVVLGVLVGRKSGGANFHPFFAAGQPFPAVLAPFGLALVAVFWTYDGWYSVNCTAGEIRDPERTIPRGLVLGVLSVTAVYVLVNLVYLLALPLERFQGVVRVGELAAAALFGGSGAALFAALVTVSIFGCLDANILFGPRVFYAMARDGHFFRGLGRLGRRGRVPTAALWCQAAWSALLCLTGTYQSLYEYMLFALLVFFAVTGLAVFVLRRKAPGLARPYRTWGYPAVPLIFIVMSLAVFAGIVADEPRKSAIGAGLLASGLPVYLVWRRRNCPPGPAAVKNDFP